MHRITPIDSAFRAYHGAARMTVNQGDDGHMMQEMFGGLFKGESRKKMEFFQNYGMTAAILPATQEQGSGGGSGGASGMPKMAEAVVSFLGGNRSHPVITGIDDRRHRPYGLKPGETAQYDDQQQMTYMKRDGLYMLSHLKASLRHISEKQKQERPPKQQSQSGGGGQQQQEDPKHEGTPTSEVLAEKDKITNWGKTKVTMAVPSADKLMVVVLADKVYLGGDPGTHTFAKVMTESGVSMNVYARIS